jgi:inhibitor of KinA sporulation pathway (predicted exonuclease)
MHIFVDFEMTCWGRKDICDDNKKRVTEIIEIGAIKLDKGYNIIDTYSQYVQPELFPEISSMCTHLTGIKNEILVGSPVFIDAMTDFNKWVSRKDSRYYSWGRDDIIQLKREYTKKTGKGSMPEEYYRWYDFQRTFTKACGFSNQLGLKTAVDMTGYDFYGKQHSAIDDAMNGAKLLVLMNKEELKEKKTEFLNNYNDEKPFTCAIGDLVSDQISSI